MRCQSSQFVTLVENHTRNCVKEVDEHLKYISLCTNEMKYMCNLIKHKITT